METEYPALTRQNAELDQTNSQQVDQANRQDASHRSQARQSMDFAGSLTQVDESRSVVVVRNYVNPPARPGGGRLSGLVTAGGAAVAVGLSVHIYFGPLLGAPVAVADVDAAGRFQVADLPPGFYSLRVMGPTGPLLEQWHLCLHMGSECRTHLLLPAEVPDRSPPCRRTRTPETEKAQPG